MLSLLIRILALMIALTCLQLNGCGMLQTESDASGDSAGSLGTLMLKGPTFGTLTLLPAACDTGERQLFLGFEFHDQKAGIATRLVVDPATGPVVRVFKEDTSFDKTLLFHRAECKTFHFSLDASGWRVNRIQILDVSLELDCRLSSGDSIVGTAKDSGCL